MVVFQLLTSHFLETASIHWAVLQSCVLYVTLLIADSYQPKIRQSDYCSCEFTNENKDWWLTELGQLFFSLSQYVGEGEEIKG